MKERLWKGVPSELRNCQIQKIFGSQGEQTTLIRQISHRTLLPQEESISVANGSIPMPKPTHKKKESNDAYSLERRRCSTELSAIASQKKKCFGRSPSSRALDLVQTVLGIIFWQILEDTSVIKTIYTKVKVNYNRDSNPFHPIFSLPNHNKRNSQI